MRINNLKKITAVLMTAVQCLCVSHISFAEANETTAESSQITSVITWDEVKEEFEKGSESTVVKVNGHQNSAPATYAEADKAIKLTMTTGQNAGFRVHNLNESNGLITISYKLKETATTDWRYGILDFDGANTYAYGYRNNNAINWDYYNGSSMTNGWTNKKLVDYNTQWLNVEYKIDLTSHNIAAKITEENGTVVHSANLGINPSVKYFSGIAIGKISGTSSGANASLLFKDLNITKEGISVTGASIEDGAEDIKPEKIEIKFSNEVSLEKVKEALKVYDEFGDEATCSVSLAEGSKSVYVTVTDAEEGILYAIEIDNTKLLGAYGSLPEQYRLTFRAMEMPMSDGTIITWDEAKNPDVWTTSGLSNVTFGYDADEDCLVAERTTAEANSKANIGLSGLETSPQSGVLDIEFKLKYEADVREDLTWYSSHFGMMQLTDTAGESAMVGLRMSDCLQCHFWDISNQKFKNDYNGSYKPPKFTEWSTVTYHIDFMNQTMTAKIAFKDESSVSFVRDIYSEDNYLRYLSFNMEPLKFSGKVSIKDLSIKRTSLEAKFSRKDNMSGKSDVIVKFNAPVKQTDLKNAVKIEDENGIEINSSAVAAAVEDDGKRGIISVFGLIPDEEYKLTLKKSLTRADGVAGLADDVSYTFTPTSADTTLSFEGAAVALTDKPSDINSQKPITAKANGSADTMLNTIKLFDKDGIELTAPIKVTKLADGSYAIAPEGGLDYDSEYVFTMQNGTETISMPIKTQSVENSGVYVTSNIVSSGNTASGTITVKNATDTAAKAVIMVAAYNSDNKLVGMKSVKTDEVAAGGSATKTVNVTASESISKTELIVWDLSSNKSIYIKK